MDSTNHKKSLEERVCELEAQVAELRKMALQNIQSVSDTTQRVTQAEKVQTEPLCPEAKPIVEDSVFTPYAMASVEETVTEQTSKEEFVTEQTSKEEYVTEQTTVKETVSDTSASENTEVFIAEDIENTEEQAEEAPETQSLELKIGKKVIPIAGSALIIFALIMFASLIQPYLTNLMKALLMGAGSLGVTALGMWKMKQEGRYKSLFAALAGCGTASCYITALVSHFTLGVLSEYALMACVVIWIAVMTVLSRYRSVMFSYICYVGILVSAYMTVQRWSDSSIGLWVYLISVTALFFANISHSYKRDAWLLIQFPLVMLLMAGIYSNSNLLLLTIFLTTAVVLAGQLVHYNNKVSYKIIFALPTCLSLIVFLACATQFSFDNLYEVLYLPYLGHPAFANHWMWSVLLSITLIGFCILFSKIFSYADTNGGRILIVSMIVFTAYVIPSLNFGAFYHEWFGTHWVPAVLALGIGLYCNNSKFRYLGYFYLFLYVIFYVQGLTIDYTVGEGEYSYKYYLQGKALVYLITLSAFGGLIWRRSDLLERMTLLSGLAFGIVELYVCNFVDAECCYIMLCCMALVLICKGLKTLPESGQGFPNQGFLICVCLFLAVMALPVRLISDDYQIINIPSVYGNPIVGLVASFMLWTLAYIRPSDKVKLACYILFYINMLASIDSGPRFTAYFMYLAVLTASTIWTYRHYTQFDKICHAVLWPCFIHALYIMDIIGGAETWALIALFVISCGLMRFQFNPVTKQLEAFSFKFCNFMHEALSLFGTYLLYSYHDNLFILHTIENSEQIVTFMLVVLTLLLAVMNLKRVNSLVGRCPEYLLSIYNGGKFTWLLVVILWRFSAVSYIISLAGILLAVAFIVAGFRLGFKGLRLYGLVQTIVCVVKLLFFDIVFDNEFYRPVSFLIAGILLFLISFIYFKLERSNAGTASSEAQEEV